MELKAPEKETEYKPVVQDDGTIKLKKKTNINRGAKSRSGGGQFELRVRKDLANKGWIVDKWSNNLDLDSGEICPAKRRFARFNANMGVMTIGTGFPDFVCFERRGDLYKVIGIEVKMNGMLSKIEKAKCAWYLKNGIFNEILIASKEKVKNKINIVYTNVEEIFNRIKKT